MTTCSDPLPAKYLQATVNFCPHFSYINRRANHVWWGEGDKMVKISDLRAREVVNILDGKKLGNIIDIDLDMERGKVLAFVLPGRLRGWSIFSRREEVIVPWEKIVRIGKDVILVEVPTFSEIDSQYTKKYLPEDERY